MVALRFLDLPILAAAAAPAIVLGAPALGYAVGAAAWIVLRVLVAAAERRIKRVGSPLRQMGVTLVARFGRIWILAGAIVGAGVGSARADGLTAAITIFVGFSIYFLTTLLTRGGQGLRKR
jgi:hypothetical protein